MARVDGQSCEAFEEHLLVETRQLALVKEHISDSRMLKLLQQFLDQNIMEELREWTPISGVPQGAVFSPVLSNLYRSEFEAGVALQTITDWVKEAGLTLHPTKTKIVDSRTESFAFLGYSFRRDKIYPRRESLAKMKARIRELTLRLPRYQRWPNDYFAKGGPIQSARSPFSFRSIPRGQLLTDQVK